MRMKYEFCGYKATTKRDLKKIVLSWGLPWIPRLVTRCDVKPKMEAISKSSNVGNE